MELTKEWIEFNDTYIITETTYWNKVRIWFELNHYKVKLYYYNFEKDTYVEEIRLNYIDALMWIRKYYKCKGLEDGQYYDVNIIELDDYFMMEYIDYEVFGNEDTEVNMRIEIFQDKEG